MASSLVMLSVFAGCRTSDNAARPLADATGVTRSLDSCSAIPRPAGRGAAGGAVAPHATVHWSGAVRAFRTFSLFIPDSARIVANDTAKGVVTLAWLGCSGCRLGVVVHADSGLGLEARIARMVASQRRIDSINSDPKTGIFEFNEIDDPPQPFVTPTGRGYLINDDCGDCAARTLLFGHPGYIADVAIGADDDVPDLSRHFCEMTVVGKTFTWR